ncbi:MAG: protein kinase [Thermoanaerobaculia bacterium]
MIGRTIAHYEILGELGAGGMGSVYLARDLRLKRQVALKVLPTELAEAGDRLARFRREAEVLAALNHPNIVTIHSVEEGDGINFLTMEHVEGKTLDKVISEGGLSLGRFLELALPLCDALATAHERGITHRDLKPANLMVTRRGQLKILDFGLAKMRPVETPTQVSRTLSEMTRHGTVLGTVPYMSPEQAKGESVDHRSDLFSAGAVLYEMATGKRPFQGQSPAELVARILRATPEPISELRPDLHPLLDRIVGDCLRKDRAHRPQSARELHTRLESLGSEAQDQAAETVSLPGAPARPRMSRMAGLAAATALAVGLLYWGVFQNGQPRAPEPPAIAGEPPAIAVLRLNNQSANPDHDYFSNGLTVALITNLARIRELKVTSPTSSMIYNGTEERAERIGRELGARYLVTGSVLEADGDVDIRVQLIDSVEDRVLWAQDYLRALTDVLVLQRDVARDVAEEIEVQLGAESEALLGPARQVDGEAYKLYLRGRSLWQRRDPQSLEQSVDYFQQAIEIAPSLAEAHAGLADAYVIMGYPGYDLLAPGRAYPLARKAAREALRLDPELAEPHATLGLINQNFEWNWEEAETEFQRAIELNPSYATAYQWYKQTLRMRGRYDEMAELSKRAQELDPLSRIMRLQVPADALFTGDSSAAIAGFEKLVAQDPGFGQYYAYLARAYRQGGRYDDAIASLERGIELVGRSPFAVALLGYHFGAAGRKDDASRMLHELEEQARSGAYVAPFLYAVLHVGLEDPEGAFRWLERSVQQRDPYLIQIVSPFLDALHSYPEYRSILETMGLGDTWEDLTALRRPRSG